MPKIYAYIGSWGGPRSNHDQGISIARYDMGKGTFYRRLTAAECVLMMKRKFYTV